LEGSRPVGTSARSRWYGYGLHLQGVLDPFFSHSRLSHTMLSTWLSRSSAPSGMPKPWSPPRPGREAPSGDENFSLLLRGTTYDRSLESVETDYTSASLSRSDSDCRTLLRKSRKRSFCGEDLHYQEVPGQARRDPFVRKQEQLTDRVIRRKQSLAVRYSTKAQFCTDIKGLAKRFYTSVIKQHPHLGGGGLSPVRRLRRHGRPRLVRAPAPRPEHRQCRGH
jgi:hypothetical protein